MDQKKTLDVEKKSENYMDLHGNCSKVAIQTFQSSNGIWQINLNGVPHVQVKAMFHGARSRPVRRRNWIMFAFCSLNPQKLDQPECDCQTTLGFLEGS